MVRSTVELREPFSVRAVHALEEGVHPVNEAIDNLSINWTITSAGTPLRLACSMLSRYAVSAQASSSSEDHDARRC